MAIGGDFTERLFVEAGLRSGMNVLDVGCGNGDVSWIVARIVGSSGSVLGIDSSNQPLEAARGRRGSEHGAEGASVEFQQGDLNALPDDMCELFDAIVGRRVLMYQVNPVDSVRNLMGALKPGGVIILHEHDSTNCPSSNPSMPLHTKVHGWLLRMLECENADPTMGSKLRTVMNAAGLTVEHVRAEAILQTPEQPYPLFPIVTAVLPRLLACDIPEDEIDIGTLQSRLDTERENIDTTFLAQMMYGACARKLG